MKVGWLVDAVPVLGGAELTQAEFRAAAPEGVEVIDCPPGGVVTGLDAYVIHNCVQYALSDLEGLRNVVKYHHDTSPHVRPDVKGWLADNAEHICCSPPQAEHMGLDADYIPPPIALDRFRQAAASSNGNRAGVCSVGSWGNAGKAPQKAAEWAQGGIDFYGVGPYAPAGSKAVPYDAMPGLLASYKTFVFLPSVIEPFGRLVAEAWAAGCDVVTNNLVGAKWWIEHNPAALDTAAQDFWELIK